MFCARPTLAVATLVFLATVLGTGALHAGDCPGPTGHLIGAARSVTGLGLAVDVHGRYAYFGDWGPYVGVLQVFDVADPSNPVRLPGWTTTGQEIGDLVVHDGNAFIANDLVGFSIYDVSTPTAPHYVTSRYDGGGYAHNVWYDGGRWAYVGFGWSDHVAIYDMNVFPALAPTRYRGHPGIRDVFVVGNRLYVFSGPGLDIVDVSTPTAPVRIGRAELPVSLYGGGGEVKVQGDYAYFSMANTSHHIGGLRIVDISTETAPVVVGSIDIDTRGAYAKGIGVAVACDRAYVAAEGGLHIFDVSDRTNPTRLTTLPVPAMFGDAIAARVQIVGNLAYVTMYDDRAPNTGGLAIYRLTVPVEVDIMPGSDKNPCNLASKGFVPVAILTTATFDAASVRAGTVRFGSDGAAMAHEAAHLEDVDGDGDTDLLLHFRMEETGMQSGDTSCALTGLTRSGWLIEGSDIVTTK